MRIQHNIAALNSYRQLSGNNNAVSKNLEKLSSGYKINRAGDDAAGLAISEKMRAQITGLEKAQDNANDGISLVQTAEGALTEVHSMLNRMVELATQSANGTFDDTVDRNNLEKELNSLKEEIDRISEATNYNGINLLDGGLGGGKVASTAGKESAEAVQAGAGSAPSVASLPKTSAKVAYAPGTKAKATATLDNLSAITHDGTGDPVKVNIKFGDGKIYDTADGTTEFKFEVPKTQGLDKAALGTQLNNKFMKLGDQTYKITNSNGALTFENTKSGEITSTEMDALKAAIAGFTAAKADASATEDLTIEGNTNLSVSGDANGTADTKASFKIDFGSMAITGANDGSTGSKVAIKIGNDTLIELDGSANMDAAAIAKKLVDQGTVEIDGKEYAISGTGTELTFTSDDKTANPPTDDTPITATPAAGNIAAKDRVEGEAAKVEIDFKSSTGKDLIGGGVEIGGQKFSFVENAADKADGTIAVVLKKDDKGDAIATALANALGASGSFSVKDKDGADQSVNFTVARDGSKITIQETGVAAADPSKKNYAGVSAPEVKYNGIGLTLQIGDTAKDFNKLTVSVGNMSTVGLGIDDIHINSQTAASEALDKIKAAINTVSSTRGDLGAIQNRLEHTINNLGVTTENMTAAESRIRDTDMAEEMMAYTKNNILVQASQAMLAQANQLPQGVLQLLQ